MNHIKKFQNYDSLQESKITDSLLIGMMTLLSSLNLSAQDSERLKDNILRNGVPTLSQGDINQLQELSRICYQLNTNQKSWSELSTKQKRNIELIQSPLLTVDMDSVDRSIVTLVGDRSLDISLNRKKDLVKINLQDQIESLTSPIKREETFVFDKISIDLNSSQSILTSQLDLEMDFKIDAIISEPSVNLHLSPTHFTPSISTIRLADDITKTTLELENIKIYTVLGFWGRNLLPGTKSVGLHIRL
jgi:hypothetical protein